MTSSGTALLLAAALCLLSACGGGDGKGAQEVGKTVDESARAGLEKAGGAASPWKTPPQYLPLVGDYRKDWSRITKVEFSGLHWKQNVSIYVNKEPERYAKNYQEYIRLYADRDLDEEEEPGEESRFEPYSRGTVFLKENYLPKDGAKPGDPLTVTAMIKRESGYDPAANDWQFVQWDVEGRILFDGNSKNAPTQAMCIKCHANMAERDFVFSTFYDLPSPAP